MTVSVHPSPGAYVPDRHADCPRTVARLLAERCASIPDEIARLMATDVPAVPDLARFPGRWHVTGIGASEGPARVLASLLRDRAGRCASFVPLSSFATPLAHAPHDVLVVVSQGLSPNAKLALEQRAQFGATMLVTGASHETESARRALEREGVRVHAHGPVDEGGLLLRVVGPPLATLAAVRIADAVAEQCGAAPVLDGGISRLLPERFARALAHGATLLEAEDARLLDRVAFVTLGDPHADATHGLAWKWLEGCGADEPPAWDVLQIAHGPFQRFYDEPITLLVLARANDPSADAWCARLAAMLHPTRHRLVRLDATLPGVAAAFEHDAMVDALLLRAFALRPRDLAHWPGQGLDGPLYGLER